MKKIFMSKYTLWLTNILLIGALIYQLQEIINNHVDYSQAKLIVSIIGFSLISSLLIIQLFTYFLKN